MREKDIIEIRKPGSQNKLNDWFRNNFTLTPRTVFGCPGGHIRSEIVARYAEEERLAYCHPINIFSEGDMRPFITGASLRELKFIRVSDEIQLPDRQRRLAKVDAVVICDYEGHSSFIRQRARIEEEICGLIPILLLLGTEDQVTRFYDRKRKKISA